MSSKVASYWGWARGTRVKGRAEGGVMSGDGGVVGRAGGTNRRSDGEAAFGGDVGGVSLTVPSAMGKFTFKTVTVQNMIHETAFSGVPPVLRITVASLGRPPHAGVRKL